MNTCSIYLFTSTFCTLCIKQSREENKIMLDRTYMYIYVSKIHTYIYTSVRICNILQIKIKFYI